MNEYIVQQGDNLSKIAKSVYGDAKLWSKIASDNNIPNPNDIRVGQVLKINMGKKDTPTHTPTNNYIIKLGDNLSKIASQHNTTVDKILKLNSISNPNVITVGQKLVLPKQNIYSPKLRTTDEIYQLESTYNKESNEDIINNWHKRNQTNRFYLIDDKKNNKLGIYKNGVLIQSFPAIHGKNKELDDMTKTYVDKNGRIINMAGNMSTPAGLYYSNKTGNYHGAPAYMRQTKDMIDKKYVDGIPSSIHKRTITETANTNGCTGLSHDSLCQLDNILKDAKDIETYILPVNPENKFIVRNNVIQFRSSDITKTPAHNTREYIPIQKIKFNTQGLNRHNIDVIKNFSNGLIKYKKTVQDELGINDDTYDKLAKYSLGILGVESGYGNQNTAIGNFLRAARKYISKNNSSPDIYSKYHTYGITGDNNSVGLTQIRYRYLSDRAKELYKKYNITKEDLVNNPEKAALATIIKLADEYRNVNNIDKVIKNYNNKQSYYDMVSKNSNRFTLHKVYKQGGIIGIPFITGI